MIPLLKEIFRTSTVSNGTATFPLASHMDVEEGALLQRVIAAVQPAESLEVGMAFGISTLFICEALSQLQKPVTHRVLDPDQSLRYNSVGLYNVDQAGYRDIVRFFQEPSEVALPRLMSEHLKLDFALIDGWHTFSTRSSLSFTT